MVAWLEEPGCFLKAKRLLLEGQEVLLLLHCRCGMGRAVLWPGPSVLLPALLCLSVLQLYLHIGLSFGVCCCRCRSVRWRMLCRCCCLGGCLATSSLRSPRSFSCRACDGPHYGCFAVMVLFRRMLGRRGRFLCGCFAAVVVPAPLASLVDAG